MPERDFYESSPEITGIHVHNSLEISPESQQIGKAALLRDLLQRFICRFQQLHGMMDLLLMDVLKEGHAKDILADRSHHF